MSVTAMISRENLPFAQALEEFPSIERWLRNKLPGTRDNYLRYMITFQKESKLDPDQFLAWARSVDPVLVQDRISEMAEGLKPSAKFNFQIEMRSFLRHNGYNSLPKASITYTLQDWHRGYKKEEVRKLLGFLDSLPHKLYVYAAIESGFRSRTVLDIKYKHVKEDFEAGIVPVAIRLGPEFYGRKKSAGFSFLGERSLALIREGIKNGLIRTQDESPLIDLEYSAAYDAVVRAKQKAGLDPKIQPNHGLRKYFEDALDSARIDKDKKMMIEGHFAGTRAKHYTSRDWDELRKVYREAYPQIDVDTGNPELAQRILSWEDEKSQLVTENQRLRERVSRLEDSLTKEVQALKEDLARLKKGKGRRR